jgi:hypothetical protein
MRRSAFITICVIAVLLGVWHLQLAMQAVFVFREEEPITSWLAIALGPAVTLILGLLAMFLRKIGGLALITCGVASLVVFAVSDGPSLEHVAAFLFQVSLPMVGTGIAFLVLSNVTLRPPSIAT